MRMSIAIRHHYNTLMKVKLFRNCDSGLLKDLVVLLKPIIYLPGDFVCRKNDVGNEVGHPQTHFMNVIGNTFCHRRATS
jgi:hypothetical protein